MRTTKYLGIGFLLLVVIAGWKLGENLSADALGMALGVIFGLMAAIPAALIAGSAQRVRHDHYHHRATETPQEQQKQPVAMIPARPIGYVVVDNTAQLQTVQQQRLEVRR